MEAVRETMVLTGDTLLIDSVYFLWLVATCTQGSSTHRKALISCCLLQVQWARRHPHITVDSAAVQCVATPPHITVNKCCCAMCCKHTHTSQWTSAAGQCIIAGYIRTLPTEGNPISATLASPDFITSNPSPCTHSWEDIVYATYIYNR